MKPFFFANMFTARSPGRLSRSVSWCLVVPWEPKENNTKLCFWKRFKAYRKSFKSVTFLSFSTSCILDLRIFSPISERKNILNAESWNESNCSQSVWSLPATALEKPSLKTCYLQKKIAASPPPPLWPCHLALRCIRGGKEWCQHSYLSTIMRAETRLLQPACEKISGAPVI